MADTDNKNESVPIKPKEQFDFFHDGRVRSVFYQLITAAIVGGFAWYLISNTAQNLETRGMNTGFGFLNVSAVPGVVQFIKKMPPMDNFCNPSWKVNVKFPCHWLH